ncbi:tRNA-specific 2-thiouridylase [bacterium]|nr:MAG: tRNA-specific 2-thiouridylase [bacterium]
MSGGVDSSVAAYLLKQATPNNFEKLFGRPTPKGFRGYDVTGVFIRSFNVDGCAERDAEDARRAAAHLGIPFYVFDFEKEYKKEVVEYMVNGYRNGLTPNPDVMCNKEIKFGLFLEKALEMGADYIATGHYVRLAPRHIPRGSDCLFAPAAKSGLDSRRVAPPPAGGGGQAERASETFHSKHAGELANFYLTEAKDKNKDQSYFLWTLTQEQLKYCLFPVGDYIKPEVREIARKASLPTAEKKDSQGICFLGEVALDEFLKDYIKPKKGPIVDENGNKIGEHDGIFFYTIGQRHGLGLGGGLPPHLGAKCGGVPYYIADKVLKINTLVVARGSDNPALFKKEIEITDVHFINSDILPEAASNVFAKAKTWASPRRQPEQGHWMPPNKLRVMARVRYRQSLIPATLIEEESGKYKLVFKGPVKFVAPGQSAVFYESGYFAGLRGRRMLGGGIIL